MEASRYFLVNKKKTLLKGYTPIIAIFLSDKVTKLVIIAMQKSSLIDKGFYSKKIKLDREKLRKFIENFLFLISIFINANHVT